VAKVPRSRTSDDHWTQLLRQAGLRRTAPRVGVLRVLAAARKPLTHAEVAEVLSPLGFERVTVYRNLMDLTEARLISRRDLGDHTWRFELRADGVAAHESAHPHFVCVSCGGVLCLTDMKVTFDASRGAPRAVRRKELEVQLRGRCDRCA
jgi:Fur family transcriptional regulator, ferric uptake regulator